MSTTTRTTPASVAYALRWPALFVILAAEVMDLLDALITSIAGPTIVRDLGGGETLIQWLAAGYTIAMASGLLIGGRLGDIHGRRRMFLLGMAGFTVMSLACALAQSPEMLIVFRVLQGLVGAVMLPQGLGMIKEMFPPDEIAERSAPSARSWGSPPSAGRSWPAGWSTPTSSAGAGGRSSRSTSRSAWSRCWPAPGCCRRPARTRPCASTSRVPRSPRARWCC
jgi:MFS family permease